MENIASFEWTSVFAEAVLFCGAVLVVLFEALAPKHKGAICAFALLAMVAAIIAYVFVPVESLSFGETLGGRRRVRSFHNGLRAAFGVAWFRIFLQWGRKKMRIFRSFNGMRGGSFDICALA